MRRMLGMTRSIAIRQRIESMKLAIQRPGLKEARPAMDNQPISPPPLLSRERFRDVFSGLGPGAGRLRLFTLPGFVRGYNRQAAGRDMRAGLNVALLDFPQGMAYALIAGLPFFCGIYASAVAALIGPLLASSRFIMLGPTNAIAVLFLSSFMSLQMSPEQKLAALPLLLLLVAVFLIAGALLRVAGAIQFISRSVITGYITAAAFLIIINQLKNVLGLELPESATFFGVLAGTVTRLGATHLPSLLLGTGTLLLYLLCRRLWPGLPNVAIALIAAYAAGSLMQRYGWQVATLGSGGFSIGGWAPALPDFSMELLRQLAGPALAIAFLSLLESASIAKVLAARAGDRVDINQQMLSMGAANIGCAFAGCMPISGSLTRSALNWSSGATSPLASMFSGAMLVLGLLTLGPWLGGIPLPALAALVITVGVSLLNRRNIRMVLGTTNADALVFLVTFGGGLLFPLDIAIYLGAATSIVFFLRKASQPQLIEYNMEQGEPASADKPAPHPPRPAVALLHVEGDLFFGSSDIFLDQARRICEDPELRIFLLRLRNAHNLDATCAMAIRELVDFARQNNRDVLICGAHPEVLRILRDSGLWQLLGEDHVFPDDPDNPNLSTRNALLQARRILGTTAEIRLFVSDQNKSPNP
jgi:SulP family sulfate permease